MTQDELIQTLQNQNRALKAKWQQELRAKEEMRADLALTINTFEEVFKIIGIDIRNISEDSNLDLSNIFSAIMPLISQGTDQLMEKFSSLMKLAPLVEKHKDLFTKNEE